MVFKEEQKGVKQVLLLEDGTKFITISMKITPNDVETVVNAAIVARTIPGKQKYFNVYLLNIFELCIFYQLKLLTTAKVT